jgi:Fe-S-cluster-containing dehydrogenase component
MKACPSKAISQRDDGIVLIDEEKCCGSAACVPACPYNAISIWRKDEAPLYGQGSTPVDSRALEKHRVGAAQKCTFNVERIDLAKEKGLVPGVDRDATPACVLACPVECRIFGDVEDDQSPPSQYMNDAEKKGRTVFAPLPEAKTRPKVAYLP